MKIRLFEDRVLLVREKKKERTSPGGIAIPETVSDEVAIEARVVAVGPGKRLADGSLVKPPVELGSRVLIKRWAGTEVTIDGEPHVIVRSDALEGEYVEN